MGIYVLKRLLLMVPTFAAITLVIFIVLNFAPGQVTQPPEFAPPQLSLSSPAPHGEQIVHDGLPTPKL